MGSGRGEGDGMSKGRLYFMIFAVVVIAAGITIGLCLHFLLPKPEEPRPPSERTGAIGDCFPQGTVTKEACESRECVFQEPKNEREPKCIFPEGTGYIIEGSPIETSHGWEFNLRRTERPRLFPESPDITELTAVVEMHDVSRVRIMFRDRADQRFHVPTEAVNISKPTSPPDQSARLYNVTWTEEPQFGIKIIRKSNGAVVFDTTVPGFTFSDQYMQLTTRLPSSGVYGFGEHNHRQFRHDMNWKKWAIFTRDVAPVDEWNLYGAQPMYMNVENDGKANGVLLLNSNAMDVVLQPEPEPAISFHVIGGVLDFYVFLGPSPENVVQQYTGAVGRPLMPPYWSLGFQLSRWDYDNLTHVKHIVDRNRDAGIPHDVQYGDIDYMESKMDFTVDRVKYDGLAEFVDELHSRGQRYIVIQDHCIGANATMQQIKLGHPYKPYEDGNAQNVWVNKSDGGYLEGEVWPGLIYYPDFTLPRSMGWWRDQLEHFHGNKSGDGWRIEYDALWIDMNEPSNFVPGSVDGCENNKWNYPPYVPQILGAGDEGRMYDKTICMDAVQHWGKHYDVHSLYGHAMSIRSFDALHELWPTVRPMVLTRSNFIGTQKYAAHWLGDNQSQWRQIPWSIVGMLEYSLFGFSYTGADICGFWFRADEEMCQRWTQLGAFYPYARNHNGQTWPDQDPAAFSPVMQRVSRDILLTRYKLLPFLYTLLYHAHVDGSTVVRPVLHEFPADQNTWTVDRQFLWGPSFMITPVMEQGKTFVDVYFPNDRWYDYYGGKEVESVGKTHNLSTPLDRIQLHVRGGHVIPWQEPANTTAFSRVKPFGLIVALGKDLTARGDLFWDDGESWDTHNTGDYLQLNFTALYNTLDITVTHDGYEGARSLVMDTIDVFGYHRRPDKVTVDSVELPSSQQNWDSSNKALRLEQLNLNITIPHQITWENLG